MVSDNKSKSKQTTLHSFMMVSIHSYVVVCLFVVCSLAGSTPHFPEVFTGKCFQRNPTGVDCEALYGNFSNAAMTDNSNVSDALYAPFFALADFSTPVNQSLFWSGAYVFATAISNDPRFYTMEETPTGYILDGMSWCGTPDHTFDYVNNCEFNSNSTYYGTSGVWTQASARFGAGASGTVYVLLQVSPSSGTNNSIFALTELPSMRVSHVTSVTVLVLVNSTRAPNERCGSGSLVELNKAVKAKFNFSATCIDDPTTLYELFCPEGVVSSQCMAATLVYQQETSQLEYRTWAIASTVVGGVILVLFAIYILRTRSKRGYDSV